MYVQLDMEATYLLASYRPGDFRVTLRYDAFETVDRDAMGGADDNNEDGQAWTLAFFWEPDAALRLGIELLDLDADRSISRRRNRLEVAKSVVGAFVEQRETDQIGLVVFGDQAYTQCPLTLDHGIVASFWRKRGLSARAAPTPRRIRPMSRPPSGARSEAASKRATAPTCMCTWGSTASYWRKERSRAVRRS